MSYARFAGPDHPYGSPASDVYVFLAIEGHLECCACPFEEELGCRSFDTTDAVTAHLDEHRAVGHEVPDDAYVRLRRDQDKNDAWIATTRQDQEGTDA